MMVHSDVPFTRIQIVWAKPFMTFEMLNTTVVTRTVVVIDALQCQQLVVYPPACVGLRVNPNMMFTQDETAIFFLVYVVVCHAKFTTRVDAVEKKTSACGPGFKGQPNLVTYQAIVLLEF